MLGSASERTSVRLNPFSEQTQVCSKLQQRIASNKISFEKANSKKNIEKIVTEKNPRKNCYAIGHVPDSIHSFQYETS